MCAVCTETSGLLDTVSNGPLAITGFSAHKVFRGGGGVYYMCINPIGFRVKTQLHLSDE